MQVSLISDNAILIYVVNNSNNNDNNNSFYFIGLKDSKQMKCEQVFFYNSSTTDAFILKWLVYSVCSQVITLVLTKTYAWNYREHVCVSGCNYFYSLLTYSTNIYWIPSMFGNLLAFGDLQWKRSSSRPWVQNFLIERHILNRLSCI